MGTIALFSGGIDSTVLLAQFRDSISCAVSVNYGQRHLRELDAAEAIATKLGIRHEEVNLRELGHHLEHNLLTGSGGTPVVPNRNMILLAVAAGIAISKGADSVAIATHAGDHRVFPDCRPAFLNAMSDVLGACHEPSVRLLTPFINRSKGDVIKWGAEVDAPFKLTWSCYHSGRLHCGECMACVERREAFRAANVTDPTVYA